MVYLVELEWIVLDDLLAHGCLSLAFDTFNLTTFTGRIGEFDLC
jgi:hypothetical protein